jgi:Na+-translocating ferredoxin:NAD+ oxidoreductase RnfD subunit
MSTIETVTSRFFYPKGSPKLRLFALWYFTTLISLWVILGHTVLGFEQSYAQPIVSILAAIIVSILLEWADARAKGRTPRYSGGLANFINFLPPAIIPGAAISMLLYPNDRLWPIVFCSALAISSKVLFRVPIGNGMTQHIFNPSNIALSIVFLIFPEVGLAPPYHFTENLSGMWYWIVPGIVLFSGIVIHALFTGRLPLVFAWLTGFAAQALIRAWYFKSPILVPLVPMTSAAFIVFTLYMIPDPATTPLAPKRQLVFGFTVAAVYGLLQVSHVVFGLFFALVIVCAIRGIALYVTALMKPAPSVADSRASFSKHAVSLGAGVPSEGFAVRS